MDVDGGGDAKRARYLQPDGSEDRGSSGQTLTLDKADKKMAHKYVYTLYLNVCAVFKCNDPKDMFVSDMMVNQAASVHNCMRSAETHSQQMPLTQDLLLRSPTIGRSVNGPGWHTSVPGIMRLASRLKQINWPSKCTMSMGSETTSDRIRTSSLAMPLSRQSRRTVSLD
jgi:hypothetical protein